MKYKPAEHNNNNNAVNILVSMNEWYAEVERILHPYFGNILELKKSMLIHSTIGTLLGGHGKDWVSM